MTLEELEKYPKEILSPKIVGNILHCDPYSLNITARDHGQAGFPYPILYDGCNLRIPKAGFVNWPKGGTMGDKPIAYETEFSPTELEEIRNYIGYIIAKRKGVSIS